MVLFAGTANRPLASALANELGIALGACTVERFPDGEVAVQLDESVRGRDIFVLQPTAPPVNDHLSELLVFADACRRAAARRITAIVPYFGYARSDKRAGRRMPVTARAVADLMESVGIDHVITVDAHTPQLDVRGRRCVIVDDMITTGGTVAEAAAALRTAGAGEEFVVAATHGVRVPGAREKLSAAGVAEVLVSDSIALDPAGEPPMERVAVAPLLAAVVRRLAAESV